MLVTLSIYDCDFMGKYRASQTQLTERIEIEIHRSGASAKAMNKT